MKEVNYNIIAFLIGLAIGMILLNFCYLNDKEKYSFEECEKILNEETINYIIYKNANMMNELKNGNLTNKLSKEEQEIYYKSLQVAINETNEYNSKNNDFIIAIIEN